MKKMAMEASPREYIEASLSCARQMSEVAFGNGSVSEASAAATASLVTIADWNRQATRRTMRAVA